MNRDVPYDPESCTYECLNCGELIERADYMFCSNCGGVEFRNRSTPLE